METPTPTYPTLSPSAPILPLPLMATTQEEDDAAGGTPDKKSGYCEDTGVYRSLHRLGPRHRFPADPGLDAASFVLSHLPKYSDHAHTKVALVDSVTGTSVTYAQLRRSVRALAAALHHALGLRTGDVVLLLSPNSVLYPVICLAVLSAGCVLTTANPLNTAAEVVKQATDSGAKLAVVAPAEAHKLASTTVPVLLTVRQEEHGHGDAGLLSVEELIEGGDPLLAPGKAACGQSDPAAILYSSGTTGVSKGVVLTHGNLVGVMTLLRWSVEVTGSRGDVFLAFLPMFHVYGLAFFALGLFCCAGPPTVVVMPRFDLRAALDAVVLHGVTNIPAVPPVILGLVKAAAAGCDLSRVRRVGTGAAPMGTGLGRAFRERYPWVELREGYGLTESGGAATFFVSAKEARRREGSVGRLFPGYQAKVVEVGSGRAAGPGGVGELWLSGPGLMRGYLGDAAAALVEAGGVEWLRTGDLCYFDEEGFLYVVDRIKELIKHKGFQVAPAELEALLLSHPHILDAAVIPVADEEAGEIPMAYVVRSERGGLSEEEVIQFVGAQVAPYKKIRKVAFIDAIPRSAAGKILRRQLVERNRLAAVPSKL